MNGAQAPARRAVLPKKRTETVVLTETLSKDALPAGGNDGFRREIRKPAGNFTASPAVSAVGIRRCGIVFSLLNPISFRKGTRLPRIVAFQPLMDLEEEPASLAKQSQDFNPFQTGGLLCPTRFGLEEHQIADEEAEGKAGEMQAFNCSAVDLFLPAGVRDLPGEGPYEGKAIHGMEGGAALHPRAGRKGGRW